MVVGILVAILVLVALVQVQGARKRTLAGKVKPPGASPETTLVLTGELLALTKSSHWRCRVSWTASCPCAPCLEINLTFGAVTLLM